MFKDKWKIATILFLLFVINLYIPHLTFAQTHPWMASKSEQILLADGIELPTIPSNDPIEIPKVEIPSDPIEIPKVKIPENKVEVPKAEIPKAPVQESTGFIDQLLKWLQKQLSLILALLCLGLGLFLLSTNPLVGTSIVMGMAVSGFGAWMADKDVSIIAQEALIGGIAGLIGLGAGALAFRLIGGRIATMAPPWLGKWLPFVGSGGVAGVADSASFDYMRDGKVDWKKAGLAGLLSVAIGFAGLGVAQYGGKLIGPAVVSKINDIPLTAVSVFKDGTTSTPKTVGDTPFGAWLQKFASNGGSKVEDQLSKLKINSQDASLIKSRLSKSNVGKEIEEYIKRGDFTEVEGYGDLLLQLKRPDMHDSVLQAFQVGERLQKNSKGKLFFEKKSRDGEPHYDIDVGEELPDGSLNNVYQLKTVQSNKKVNSNITSAAKQLVNAPANNKIIEIRVKDGTWDEFQAQNRLQGLEKIAKEHRGLGMKLNITFSDGVTKSWLF
ncbi:hypothetical protein EDC32_102205 [Laceyella sacchari]|uniref:hypothetical protein n=1 Tax=Laceyella sacchari TaxID=37482 RepID=UPI001050D3D7|nr:hypothetical protein [Laceyella sacchari]TCW38965.1 hypothetical protein EDC32_102205 [Laceyella sacchari]